MTLERINPESLARPSGFSHAVRAIDTVRVHLAGQTGMDRDGRIVGGGVVAQFEQALRQESGSSSLTRSRANISPKKPDKAAAVCRNTAPRPKPSNATTTRYKPAPLTARSTPGSLSETPTCLCARNA